MQKTVVELITCFSASDGPATLPLATASDYIDLLTKLKAEEEGIDYADFAKRPGVVLGRLFCPDLEGAFWASYLDDEERDNYPQYGWKYFLPIAGNLRKKLFLKDPPDALKITQIPRVWIFPSGCAVSIRLLVTGNYDLLALASLVDRISSGELHFCWDGNGVEVTPPALRTELAAGLREVVLGKNTSWRKSKSYVMTTILDSGRKLMSRREALDLPFADAIEDLINPAGPPLRLTDSLMLRPKNEEDAKFYFVAATGYSFFIWLQRLLISSNPHDRIKLRRYHDNTVRSLLIHWQQRSLLDRLVVEGHKPSTADRTALTQAAIDRLSTAAKSSYGNRALKAVRNEGLTELLTSAKAAIGIPGKPSGSVRLRRSPKKK